MGNWLETVEVDEWGSFKFLLLKVGVGGGDVGCCAVQWVVFTAEAVPRYLPCPYQSVGASGWAAPLGLTSECQWVGERARGPGPCMWNSVQGSGIAYRVRDR